MHAMLNIAVRAARQAGSVIVRHINQLEALEVVEKGRNEFVSQVDRLAEETIIAVIREYYPEHAILAEESGRSGDHDYQWIIDPLDVVYDPLRQEVFTASRGQGAQLDGRRIRVSKRVQLGQCLIATGFPYRMNRQFIDEYLGMLKAVMQESAGIRRPGSAALDLCYVAAGRVDGFWEIGLNAWDIAAGALMIKEAGASATFGARTAILRTAMWWAAIRRSTRHSRSCSHPTPRSCHDDGARGRTGPAAPWRVRQGKSSISSRFGGMRSVGETFSASAEALAI